MREGERILYFGEDRAFGRNLIVQGWQVTGEDDGNLIFRRQLGLIGGAAGR
jgi:hypothetical protein